MFKKMILLIFLIFLLNTVNYSAKKNKCNPYKFSKDFYVVKNLGGNVAFLITDEGVVVVDTGDSFSAGQKIVKIIKSITDKPIKYIIMTHFHSDHVSGLPAFPERASVIASVKTKENIEKYIKLKNINPDITFKKKETIKIGNEFVELINIPNTHSSVSSIVKFKNKKYVNVGDIVFDGIYIGPEFCGSSEGWIKAFKKIAEIDFIKLIPSHGNIKSNKKALINRIDYLTVLRTKIQNYIDKGVGLEKIKGSLKFQEVDPEAKKFLSKNIETIYNELKG